jgi:hypothetical protein
MTTSLHAKARPSRARRLVLAALALTAVGALATIGVTALTQQVASAEPAVSAVAGLGSWADNGKGGQRVLQLVKGAMPAVGAVVSGTVKTDTNCDPDAQGINHCHNVIGLANGGEIEVIHNHMMMTYECLSPGQKLSLTPLNSDWVVANDAP